MKNQHSTFPKAAWVTGKWAKETVVQMALIAPGCIQHRVVEHAHSLLYALPSGLLRLLSPVRSISRVAVLLVVNDECSE